MYFIDHLPALSGFLETARFDHRSLESNLTKGRISFGFQALEAASTHIAIALTGSRPRRTILQYWPTPLGVSQWRLLAAGSLEVDKFVERVRCVFYY